MKINIRLVLVLIIFALGVSVQAKKKKKKVTIDTITVFGNCGMCKTRIEAALDAKGVKSAEWNIQTKKLVVAYVPAKISLEEIKALVTAAGHDTETKKAEDAVYKTLPGCCLFRENPNTHTD